MNKRTISLIAVLLGLFQAMPAGAQEDNLVHIVLHAQASVDDTLVSLGQIARISGGGTALRKRIANLDIADFKLDAGQVVVSCEQVRFRLLLAGIDAEDFRVDGAKRTIVSEGEELLTLRSILASAEQALRQQYPGDANSVIIHPRKGVELPLLAVGPSDQVQALAKVKAPVPYKGQARVDVSIQVNGKTREVVPVTFDLQATPRKTAPLARGHAPGSISVIGDGDVVIKSHDNVKIVARIGSARIEAVGEAQQDGQVGQIIRVRNTESNRVVHGRVEASGIVLVDY